MTTIIANANSEAAILGRVIDPQQGAWSPEASRAILSLKLADHDRQRMNELAAKASEGLLTPDEEIEIEGYRHVCRLIDLLKARARVSLG